MEERLQNILSHRGVASRRAAATMIEEGRVRVNGRVVTAPGERFDPAVAAIEVDGRRIGAAEERRRTVMLYKPAGVLSTMHDPFGGKTVAELVKTPERLVPVGRLDKDSEGLLVMSNDGDLALRLTHPRFEHEKTYVVRAAGRWSDAKLELLRSPLEIEGYRIRPCEVELVRKGEDNVHVLVFKLREGRKRQVRYMCSAAHLTVLSLKRVQMGALRLDPELKPGQWRDLSEDELSALESPPPRRGRRKEEW